MRRFMDVQYSEYEETLVDIYLPDTDRYTTVVDFHGGGLDQGSKYSERYEEMSERFQFPVLDANSEWEITACDEVLKAKYISADGLHPNDTGHRYIAEKFLEFMGNL